jgi:hypothetical protein
VEARQSQHRDNVTEIALRIARRANALYGFKEIGVNMTRSKSIHRAHLDISSQTRAVEQQAVQALQDDNRPW